MTRVLLVKNLNQNDQLQVGFLFSHHLYKGDAVIP